MPCPELVAAQQQPDARWRRPYSWWRLRGAKFAVLATALLPGLLVYIALRSRSRRPLVGIRQKLTGNIAAAQQPNLLVHGVSLGETALMRPLVPRIEAAFGVRCLLSTTTDTGWQGLEQGFPGHQRVFLPFDLPWAVERFLTLAKPRAVVLLEAEFWPVLISACGRRGIPVVLVNARLSTPSFAIFRPLRRAIAPLFASYVAAGAQNGLYAARLRVLGCRGAVPCGSLKADMIRLATPAQVDAEGQRTGLVRGEAVLLLASTSGPEEAAILSAWRTQSREWRIVICPRHPERGDELVALCAGLGLAAVRSSTGAKLAGSGVLIVDEIGRLGALYGWCAREEGIAVVGGGLGSGRHGQNMLEAAAASCATVVGWDLTNQPDSMHLLRACGGVVEATPDTLAARLAELAADAAARRALAAAGHRAWLQGQGALERVLAQIVSALGRSFLSGRSFPSVPAGDAARP
jgi:3-deoxy-D-manno-octulosonic-acid transferase